MKSFLRAAALGVALSVAAVAAAQAQNAPRVYENGSVWSVSYVESKPGMFDDYMAYLNTGWRQSNELRKKAGDVLSYKVLFLPNNRDGGPDMMLMIEFKNMAVFDRDQAEVDKETAAVFGSVARANQGQIDREKLRALRGQDLARELTFK